MNELNLLRSSLDNGRRAVEGMELEHVRLTGGRSPATHGTVAGYVAHRTKWATPACAACKSAHAAAEAARREGKKKAAEVTTSAAHDVNQGVLF